MAVQGARPRSRLDCELRLEGHASFGFQGALPGSRRRARARARPGSIQRRRLPPSWAGDHLFFGHFAKGLEYFRQGDFGRARTIRRSPSWYGGKAWVNFGLKNYDQSIEWARQAIAINPNYIQYIHTTLVAALALTGHDAEVRQALQRYLALPSTGPFKTIAAWKAYSLLQTGRRSTPRRGERAGVRRPAQSRDAGGMSATRCLAAIPAAELVGYSRLMGEDETGTARAVRDPREGGGADRSRIWRPRRQDDGRRRAAGVSVVGRRLSSARFACSRRWRRYLRH